MCNKVCKNSKREFEDVRDDFYSFGCSEDASWKVMMMMKRKMISWKRRNKDTKMFIKKGIGKKSKSIFV